MILSRFTFRSLVGGLALGAVFMFTSTTTSFAQTGDAPSSKAKDNPYLADNAAKQATNRSFYNPAPATAPADRWSGLYVGGFAGLGVGRSTADTSTIYDGAGYFLTTSVAAINASGHQRLTPKNFTVGGQAGYNFQSGKWVYGAEADLGFLAGSNSASTTTTYPCCSPQTFTISQTIKNRWLFTARPRFGYSTGKALIYATGGLAMTGLNYTSTFTDNHATANESGGVNKTKLGWAGGGGIEYAFDDKWSFKGEYLYTGFGRSTTTSTNLSAFSTPLTFPTNIFTHSINYQENNFRFGVNYRF